MPDRMLSQRMINDPVRFAHSCRKRAEVMHTIASTMSDPGVKAALERQAEEWERMACAAERNIRQNQPASEPGS